MDRRKWLLFLLVSAFASISVFCWSAEVTCELVLSQPVTEGVSGLRVSNLERIQLVVAVDTDEMLTIRNEQGDGNLAVHVFRISGAQRLHVPIKLTGAGGGARQDKTTLSVLLEVPIDENLRRVKIEKYIDELQADALANNELSGFQLDLFNAQRSKMATELDKILVENRVGAYEVVCEFFPEGASAEDAKKSDPLRFEVIFLGEPLDQPSFRNR